MDAPSDLAAIATWAQTAFSELWDGAGVSKDEQEQTLSTLVSSVRTIVEGAMHEQQAKLETMREELPGLRVELATLRDVLGGDVRAVPAEDSSLLLVPQRDALAAALDAAKALKAERSEARKGKEEQLATVRAELDGEEGPVPEEEAARRNSIVPEADAAGGLSLATLGRIQAKMDAATDEKAARVTKLEGLVSTAAGLRAALGYPPEPSADDSISRATVTAIEVKIADYEAEAERRKAVLADCGEYIQELRVKLAIPEAEWVVLPTAEDAGLSQEVLEAYHGEMERLEVLKAATLGPLLDAARSRLRPLWKSLHMSEGETKAFEAGWPASDDAEDAESLEEQLDSVEEEERRLKTKLDSCTEAISKMERRAEILEQRDEMIANQKDPSRLLNKRDGGRLLREEKLRKAVEKELPFLNKKLRQLAAEWTAEHGGGTEALTFNGVAIVQQVDEQETEDERTKQEEIDRRNALKKGGQPDIKPNPKAQKKSVGPAGPSSKPASKAAPAPKKADPKQADAKQAVAAAAAAALLAPPPPPMPERDLGAEPPAEAGSPKHAVPTERVLQVLSMDAHAAPAAANAPTEPTAAKGAVAQTAEEENAPMPIA